MSKEMIAEYDKYGLKPEPTLQDELFEEWLRTTSIDGLSEFTHRKEKEITSIHVKQVSKHEYNEDGKEQFDYFVVYDCVYTRIDVAGNPVQRYLPRQGQYPVLKVHYKLGPMEFGKSKREVDYVEGYDVGYTTPWTKANLLKLIKEIPLTKEAGGPNVGIVMAGGLRFTVQRFDELLNAESFDEILGNNVNDDTLARILRQRNESLAGLQEKPLTQSDVERMLLESKQQQKKVQ